MDVNNAWDFSSAKQPDKVLLCQPCVGLVFYAHTDRNARCDTRTQTWLPTRSNSLPPTPLANEALGICLSLRTTLLPRVQCLFSSANLHSCWNKSGRIVVVNMNLLPSHPWFLCLCGTDTCYILSFAIIMLNTSLHNPNVKDKPTVERFISMNRGINEGGDLPEDLLRVSGTLSGDSTTALPLVSNMLLTYGECSL